MSLIIPKKDLFSSCLVAFLATAKKEGMMQTLSVLQWDERIRGLKEMYFNQAVQNRLHFQERPHL